MKYRKIRSLFLASLFCAASAGMHAAVITQIANTTSGKDWNDASTWGATAASGNTYFSTTGFMASTSAGIGNTTYTSLLRENGVTFNGTSITLVSGTQLLLKQALNQASNGNIILSGGSIRHSTGDNSLATISGILNVAAESWIGEGSGSNNNTSNAILTISSTLIGSATLHLGAAVDPGTIAFTGDLSGFSGTLDIGNSVSGRENLTVSLSGANLGNATVKMGFYTSMDILNLTGSTSMKAFNYNGTVLGNGTYDVSTLNSMFGSQFTGTGSLTVVPEPSTFAMLLGSLGITIVFLCRVRRRPNI